MGPLFYTIFILADASKKFFESKIETFILPLWMDILFQMVIFVS